MTTSRPGELRSRKTTARGREDRAYEAPLPPGGGTKRPSASSEPIVRSGDKLQVPCPDCGLFGTHAGTCDWSFARSARVWAFYAVAVDIVTDGAALAAQPQPSDATMQNDCLKEQT